MSGEIIVPGDEPLPDPDPTVLAIIQEIYVALERLHASPELLALVGGWRDTATDAETLDQLKLFNRTGSIFDSVDITADD